MAWKPENEEAFKSDYMAGLNNLDLAAKADINARTMERYISQQVRVGSLPKRGTFKAITGKVEPLSEQDVIDSQLISRLKKSSTNVSLLELANDLDVSPKKIEAAVERLRKQNYLIDMESGAARMASPAAGLRTDLTLPYERGNRIKFGFVADAHLCSKYAAVDRLHLFFKLAVDKGVTEFFDGGNWIDGEARFNKTDLLVHGMDDQIKYWAANWPQHPGVTTRFVAGDDHEGWYQQREGIEIGKHAEEIAKREGRDDLIYLGYMEHDIVVPSAEGQTVIRVQHPGGGSAYALSYTPQKIVESLTGGEKPNILLLGHYHKAGSFFLRNIHTILGGCFQMQSPFMRKKRLAAHLGGWIVEFLQAPKGDVLELTTTFVPFYDVANEEKWTYRV